MRPWTSGSTRSPRLMRRASRRRHGGCLRPTESTGSNPHPMHTLRILLCIAFVVAIVVSAARTAWVVYHEGFETDRTTSWLAYTVTQRWPWVTIAIGGAA